MIRINLFNLFLPFLLVFAIFSCAGDQSNSQASDRETAVTTPAKTVNLYTYRYLPQDKTLYEQFTASTNIKVNITLADAQELITRLVEEGEDSPADLIILPEIVDVALLKESGLLQPFSSPKLDNHVPAKFRDPKGYWVGLTRSTMGFIVAKGRSDPAAINRYMDLTSERWKGKLLVSSSTTSGNHSLMTDMVAFYGEEKAKSWAEGVISNLAAEPFENDFELIKAIAEGTGEVGLVDMASLIQLMRSGSPENFDVGASVIFKFGMNEENKSFIHQTVACLKNGTLRRGEAVELAEYITDEKGQKIFPDATFEYPVNPLVIPGDFLIEYGGYLLAKEQQGFNMEDIVTATTIFKEVNWK